MSRIVQFLKKCAKEFFNGFKRDLTRPLSKKEIIFGFILAFSFGYIVDPDFREFAYPVVKFLHHIVMWLLFITYVLYVLLLIIRIFFGLP